LIRGSPVPPAGSLEGALKRDGRIVLAALALSCGLAWAYVLLGAGTGMSPFGMTTASFPPFVGKRLGAYLHEPWSAGTWLIMLLMWWVMMVAMMTPSATPMILLHATITRRGRSDVGSQNPATPTIAFVAGYLAIWFLFAASATGLELAFERLGLVSPMWMWSESWRLTGALLIAAGLYQLTPLKTACLDSCRSPIEFLSRHWRAGPSGAFGMGVVDGAYCVGCCCAVMLLLFAGGVMNLLWIAALSVVVVIEKTAPFGRAFGRALGALLLAVGSALLVRPQWFGVS
jgi:predicted metal-binding membrane protein